jgi:hypothetical protein
MPFLANNVLIHRKNRILIARSDDMVMAGMLNDRYMSAAIMP